MSKEYIEALGLVKRTCELYIETTRFLKGSDIIANQIKEALNTIQNRLESIDNAEPSEALECLDKLALLTCNIEWYKDNINTIKQALINAEKEHKALEIIKKKKVSIFQLSCCKNVNEYNELKFKDSEKLTEEEFNLLKEILGC